MGWETAAERKCDHCVDGHMRPDAKPWGAFISGDRDSDGQPTTIHVMHTACEHVATSDVEWINDRLNHVVTQPGEALDVLGRFAEDDELGKHLPGLGAVVDVLRGQIAQALMDKSEEERKQRAAEDLARSRLFSPGGGLVGGSTSSLAKGGPVSLGGISVNEIVVQMDKGQERDKVDREYVEARRRQIMKRRGLA